MRKQDVVQVQMHAPAALDHSLHPTPISSFIVHGVVLTSAGGCERNAEDCTDRVHHASAAAYTGVQATKGRGQQ